MHKLDPTKITTILALWSLSLSCNDGIFATNMFTNTANFIKYVAKNVINYKYFKFIQTYYTLWL